MAKEICISSTPHETRLAILEDDQLAEIYYERENEYTLAGSIYNGRVTRVLPGMQSAFVDLGLERDAFLYVTDFLELEDQEEADELEKAAATGASQAPREIRHPDSRGGRGDDRGGRNGQKQEPKQEPKPDQRGPQDRSGRDRRPESAAAEQADGVLTPSQPFAETGSAEASGDEAEGAGARRWRGRRRRRGGRSQGGSPEGQREPAAGAKDDSEAASEAGETPTIHAAAARPEPAPPQSGIPAKFVLPGESLSKYGGAPQSSSKTQDAPPAQPPRPASSFKPASLVEKPIEWDGSGLLPGETLSRHRGRQPEPAVEEESAQEFGAAADAIEEQGLVDAMVEFSPPPANETEVRIGGPGPGEESRGAAEQRIEDEPAIEAESNEDPPPYDRNQHVFVRLDFDDPDAVEIPEPPRIEDEDEEPGESRTWGDSTVRDSKASDSTGEQEPGKSEHDRSASHNVDPLPPSGFRLFGLGGKKKKGDEAETAQPAAVATVEPLVARPEPAAKPASVSSVSAFAPGQGLVEEEVIEGEEYDAPSHHHRKTEEHDLDDFEEETLQTQIRSGELGELLQEAHLDHRIQLEFEDKNGEEEDEEADEEEDEPETAAAGSQPASTDGAGQQRRDRYVRGQRGRSGQGPRGRGAARRSAQTSDLPIISDLLKPGQEILVQIAKEPIAKKGARITSHIALPGRFLVFMPTVGHVGVSRKIASYEERQRLKRILISERGEASGGFIVRTAAEGASEEDLRADLRFLLHLWDEIKSRSESSKSPALIYHDLSLIERILRDQVSANFSSIWVDTEADYERIVRFLNRFSPTLVRRVKLYTKEIPLFEHFGIQDEISKALRSKVWLKSGGSIVINQTEALVAIDINTGKYVGKSARLEDTILKTNLDAVPEIVRQIRLRDLGGIIVIDFIDMDERKNRFKVMAALEEALKTDRAPTKVLQFNDFGLVAITRKRVKQSLERTLSVPCPTCQATGMVKSPATVCNEIYIELRKMKKHFENADVLLRVNPETVKVLKANNANWLTEFEELVGKNILVKSDATLHPEQFDIQG
jgi:Rne/Rng family ribonuclease